MKKFFSLFFIVFILNNLVLADSWDDFSDIDKMWDGQKAITNQEFENVVEKLEEKNKEGQTKINRKKRKKLFGSGTTLHSELNPDNEINEISDLKKEDNIINVPVQLIINNQHLEKGFYKVVPEEDDKGKKYVCFYQSQYLKAKLEVIETGDDFEESTIDFAKIIPHNESFIKFIYGSIDFNAYAFVPYIN